MLANPSFHGGGPACPTGLARFTYSDRYTLSLSSSIGPFRILPKTTLVLPSSPYSFSSSLNLPRKGIIRRSSSARFHLKSSGESEVLESETHSNTAQYCQPHSVKIPVGDRHILVETGHMGRQASAAVTVTDGETAGTRTIDLELTTLASTYHVELNPSDAGFQDRYIVQEIIKEMAKNRPIDTKGKKGFKVLVLNEVDKLSREAQHSLRRTMEKYSTSCRLILCCNSSSKVTEAVRSRCLNVRISAPTEDQIVKVLEFIGKKEGLQLPPGFVARIAEKSNRSLRRSILAFETCRVQQYPFTSNQALPPMDWEEYVSEITSDIMKEQSPKRLFQVRGKLYKLLLNCIPPEIVLKRLLFELLKKLDAELKHEVCHWAAYYEHRMRLGQKAIFHLEAFVAKFMSIYKSFLIATFG